MSPKELQEAGDIPPWRELLERRCRGVASLRTRVLRQGGEVAIHRLRVATRRLQELLAFLQPFLPAREAGRLARRARKIRRSLGVARNADVLRRLVASLAPRLSSSQGRALRVLATRLTAGRRTSRRPRSLPGFRRRSAELRAVFSDPPIAAVRSRAGALLDERLGRIAAARRVARRGSPEAMHRLRIAVKRYRYLLEILDSEGFEGADAALQEVRAVQQSLGELHDVDMLRELLAGGGGSKELLDALDQERSAHLDRTREILATLPLYRAPRTPDAKRKRP